MDAMNIPIQITPEVESNRFTPQKQIEFFETLENLTRITSEHILSFSPLKDQLYNLFLKLAKDEDPILFEKINKADINNLVCFFRTNVADWHSKVNQILLKDNLVKVNVKAQDYMDWKSKFFKLNSETRKYKNLIAEQNFGLVNSEVCRIKACFKCYSLAFEDLFQEGCFGLLRAIDKFDYKKGYRFSTYSGEWIRYFIKRSIIEKDRTIRLNKNIHKKFFKIRKEIDNFISANSRIPSVDEIKKITNYDDSILDIFLSHRKVEEYAGTEEKEYGEFYSRKIHQVVDEKIATTIDNFEMSESKDLLINSMATLTAQQKIVINSRFGFGIRKEIQTLQEIANTMNVSRERIRQVEKLALEKMKENLKKKNIQKEDLF